MINRKRINDLKVEQISETSVNIQWGVLEGFEFEAEYDIRMSENQITEKVWQNAERIADSSKQLDSELRVMTVSHLKAGMRYWFAIKVKNSKYESKISVSVANKPQNFDQIDVWQMCGDALNARNRRLMEAIMPDFIGRTTFEYVGTAYIDRSFESCPALELLKNRGALLGCGYAYPHYTPFETISDKADRNKLGASDDITTWGPDAFEPNEMKCFDFSTDNPDEQMIYKGKRLIDFGFDAIELDLSSMNESHAGNIYNQLKDYAKNIGRTVYITGNGDNIPSQYKWDNIKRFIYADFALRQYPRNWIDAQNHITYYKNNIIRDGETKPSVAFVDCGPMGLVVPEDKERWPFFYRASEAQLLASGILPGSTYLYGDYIGRDNYVIEMNIAKFIRENREIFHNISYIDPVKLSVTAENVYTSALEQSCRTLLHLVNGNYSNENNTMTAINGFKVEISLNKAPSRIWMTTPDLISEERRQILSYTYFDGVASIEIARLEFHNIIVIEYDNEYNPIYNPMEILFPFPIRKKIPVGNKTHIYALQTEGHSSKFYWYVNNIPGGLLETGFIDESGNYHAPIRMPADELITIKAQSTDNLEISEEIEMIITEAHSKIWNENFADDKVGSIPSGWEIIDGKGDWKISLDEKEKVLHEYNIGDSMIPGIIVGGDQNRSGCYTFSCKVKINNEPVTNMNMPSQKKLSYFELIFGYIDENAYYSYRFCFDNSLRLFKKINDNSYEIGNPVSYRFPDVGLYHDLQINVSGDSCKIYDKKGLIRNDQEEIGKGGIGFGSARTDIFFKNISIQADDS